MDGKQDRILNLDVSPAKIPRVTALIKSSATLTLNLRIIKSRIDSSFKPKTLELGDFHGSRIRLDKNPLRIGGGFNAKLVKDLGRL